MKRFLFTIAIALVAALSAPAYAAGLDSNAAHAAGFSKLSEAEKAEILKQIATKAQANSESSVATVVAEVAQPAKVDQWLNIGERIGKMIGGAAKEVGVAVNDFVKTPVGMTAMALIVWHYMGGVIIHAFGALLILGVGLSFILYFARRRNGAVIEYDTEKKDIFGRSVIKKITNSRWEDGDIGGFMVATAIVIVASMLALFTY